MSFIYLSFLKFKKQIHVDFQPFKFLKIKELRYEKLPEFNLVYIASSGAEVTDRGKLQKKVEALVNGIATENEYFLYVSNSIKPIVANRAGAKKVIMSLPSSFKYPTVSDDIEFLKENIDPLEMDRKDVNFHFFLTKTSYKEFVKKQVDFFETFKKTENSVLTVYTNFEVPESERITNLSYKKF